MSEATKNEYILTLNKSNIDTLLVRTWSDKYDKFSSMSVFALSNSYREQTVELLYASHKEEAIEQLDELIDKLSAIRQDLDKTGV